MSHRFPPNRLIHETSPYLLQHAYNPVDWYPWCREALERAQRENKPLFLSIGYSACHWCHVMEEESFEDPETAAFLNQHFICIKVDREERPDLDHLYMVACQLLTGHGGWPLSVFLTPEGKPFYAGTYFPPTDRFGMPSFRRVLTSVAQAWATREAEVRQQAEQLWAALQQALRFEGRLTPGGPAPRQDLAARAVQSLARRFDPVFGGFSRAPKFPHALDLILCLRYWRRTAHPKALQMATRTLTAMACGGIYDQLGGGFHRYAVDAQWLVPHFEKMLYDNAMLLSTYAEAFEATREPLYARILKETAAYLTRDMQAPQGGFYSSQDADSEGEEGKYYTWSMSDLENNLPREELELVVYLYGVTPQGNGEGKNILHVVHTLEEASQHFGKSLDDVRRLWQEARRKLLDARARRVPPARDEKILACWNGLAIQGLCDTAAALASDDWIDPAQRCATFVWQELVRPDDGQERLVLGHSWKDGRWSVPGFLDDYAAVINGFLSLYEQTCDPIWSRRACLLADSIWEQFWDPQRCAFRYAALEDSPAAELLDLTDSSTPSATGLALLAALRLGLLMSNPKLLEAVEQVLGSCGPVLLEQVAGCTQMVLVHDFLYRPPLQVALTGPRNHERFDSLRQIVRSEVYCPWKAVAGTGPEGLPHTDDVPLLRDKTPLGNLPTAYVCVGTECRPPVTGPDQLRELLEALAGPPTSPVSTAGQPQA